MLPEHSIRESVRQEPEEDEGVEQRVDAAIGKAHRGGALCGDLKRTLECLKRLFREDGVVSNPLDVKETSVGPEADLPECGKVVEPSPDPEIIGVVDRGLSAEGPALFVVLLDASGFVIDVQRGGHAFGNHTRAEE